MCCIVWSNIPFVISIYGLLILDIQLVLTLENKDNTCIYISSVVVFIVNYQSIVLITFIYQGLNYMKFLIF